jgi:hypothetical protein
MQFLKTNLQQYIGDLNKKFLKETKQISIVMVKMQLNVRESIMFLPWVWVFFLKL